MFREINFLELLKYCWNLQMLRIIEKFKNWKILLSNSWKIVMPFGRQSWKIGGPWHICTKKWDGGTLLARWNLGTWAPRPRWHPWHALQAIYQTRMSLFNCESCNYINKQFAKFNFLKLTQLQLVLEFLNKLIWFLS